MLAIFLGYAPSSIIILLIAAIVALRGRSKLNRRFAILVALIGLWIGTQLTSYFMSGHSALLMYRFSTIFPNLMGMQFVLLGLLFLKIKLDKKILALCFLPAILITPLAFTDKIIRSATEENGLLKLEVGSLYGLQTAVLILYALAGAGTLFLAYRRNRKNQHGQQIILLLYSFAVPVIINFFTNYVFISNEYLELLWPTAFLIMVIIQTYAIVKHKLFDLRLVVARTFGYILSVSVLGFVYAVTAFTLVDRFLFNGSVVNRNQQFIYVILAILVSTTLQPIKMYFNKLTNRLFYRDAYDTKLILGQVSSVILGSVDSQKLQRGALNALYDALKPTYTAFLLVSKNKKLQQSDTVGFSKKLNDIDELSASLKNINKNIIVSDELEENDDLLGSSLRREDIIIVSPLLTKDELIGYLILGPKKSGNVYNSQDVGLLSLASNELAVALQNSQRFEEIQIFNKTLQDKVTEATRELKVTNRKLVHLDEAKDEFISMASHQLRTPLTSIKGYLSMVVEGDLGPIKPKQEKVLQDAFGSSQRMAYLIADFLNVSRIKTGKFMIEKHEVDLPQIVQEEIRQLEEMAESRDLKLIYEKPGVFPRVKLDENKTRQVMMNMVDNAIYYTPSGGAITIQLYALADEIIFKVIDTGIGVPKKEQHKLFTKFFRAGNARKARPDGTGLGLFMAQKVVVEQGGAVIFESTEGKGSTFGFRFPLKKIKL